MSYLNAYRLRTLANPQQISDQLLPAALPLSIIALEEIGKLVRIYHASRLTKRSDKGWRGFKRTFKDHHPKQIYAQSALFGRFLRSLTFIGMRCAVQHNIERNTYESQLNEVIRKEQENVETLKQLGYPSPYYPSLKRRLNLDRFKQLFLYVDFDARSGHFRDVLGTIDEDHQLSKSLLSLADIRVEACKYLGIERILDHWENQLSNDEHAVREMIVEGAKELGPTTNLIRHTRCDKKGK